MIYLLRIGLLFVMLFLAACSDSPPGENRLENCQQIDTSEITLEPGDELDVFVWRDTGQTSYKIGTDGRFTMAIVGEILAAGKTQKDIAREIELALSRHIESPKVTVVSNQALEQGSKTDLQCAIAINGEANNPTTISYRPKITVLDAIIMAGGLTEFADGNKAVLVRGDRTEKTSLRLRLNDLVHRGDISEDYPLAPGDQIIIPRKGP